MQDILYLDCSATTRMDPWILEKMKPFFYESYGNPSSKHRLGLQASEAVVIAREEVANLLGVHPTEVYFTSGGTESNNWILKTPPPFPSKSKIITSTIEHHSVENCLGEEGLDFFFVNVDPNGYVKMDELEKLLQENKDDVWLVSIMHANNEIGTIQDIKKIAELAHQNGALFHTDAVQTIGKLDLNAPELGIDFLSLSGHKFHGPKGVGALYINKEIEIDPFMDGGGQEFKKRAGTLNTPGIVGLGAACHLASQTDKNELNTAISVVSRGIIEGIQKEIPDSYLNGGLENRLAGNINFSFDDTEGESLVDRLSEMGLMTSAGSACNCEEPQPSHVIKAIGKPDELAWGCLRITHEITDCLYINPIVQAVKKAVESERREKRG